MKSDFGDTKIPNRATVKSAGYDFYAPEKIELHAGEWTEIDTGISFDDDDKVEVFFYRRAMEFNNPRAFTKNGGFADTWVMLLLPKSGLGFKYGVRLANTVGVIDQDYRDHIKVKLTCEKDVTIEKGDKFMQGIFVPFGALALEEKPVEERKGGFGSTGN